MILKLQRPLNAFARYLEDRRRLDGEPVWFAYDQPRTFECLIPEARLPAHIRKAMGADQKGYFEVTVRNGKVVEWHHRTVTQPW